jgi:hypothetical protein
MIKETEDIGYYSLIQYRPNEVLGEVANIGILLFSTKTGFIGVRVTPTNKRVVQIFGGDIHDYDKLKTYKEGLAEWEKTEHRMFEHVQTAKTLLNADNSSNVIFTPLISVLCENGYEKMLDKLYEDFFPNDGIKLCVGIAGYETILGADFNGRNRLTIAEMYKIKNDRAFAFTMNRLDLYEKYNEEGYGHGFSQDSFPSPNILSHKFHLFPNRILDIRHAGHNLIYRITLTVRKTIDVTGNHKFSTYDGVKAAYRLALTDFIPVLISPTDNVVKYISVKSIEPTLAAADTYVVEMNDAVSRTFATENGIVTCSI